MYVLALPLSNVLPGAIALILMITSRRTYCSSRPLRVAKKFLTGERWWLEPESSLAAILTRQRHQNTGDMAAEVFVEQPCFHLRPTRRVFRVFRDHEALTLPQPQTETLGQEVWGHGMTSVDRPLLLKEEFRRWVTCSQAFLVWFQYVPG